MDDEPRADGPDERSRSGAFQNACNQGAFTCGTCGYSYSHVFSVGGVCIDCDADRMHERERWVFKETGMYLGLRRGDMLHMACGGTGHKTPGITEAPIVGVKVRDDYATIRRINCLATGRGIGPNGKDVPPLPHHAVVYAYQLSETTWYRKRMGYRDLRASDVEVIVLRETMAAGRRAYRDAVASGISGNDDRLGNRLVGWVRRAMRRAARQELDKCWRRSVKKICKKQKKPGGVGQKMPTVQWDEKDSKPQPKHHSQQRHLSHPHHHTSASLLGGLALAHSECEASI